MRRPGFERLADGRLVFSATETGERIAASSLGPLILKPPP